MCEVLTISFYLKVPCMTLCVEYNIGGTDPSGHIFNDTAEFDPVEFKRWSGLF